ncbi:phage major capsid protein [Brevifollis gellanilyticus]|nr:phage major capsid protein [Brevifollis gellanilyticus]
MKALTPLLFTLLLAPALVAQPAADPNQRLRDTLKNTMLQLRAAETERATLQANQLVNEAKIKELTTQVETLNKQIAKITKDAAAEEEAAKKQIDDLKAKQEAQAKQIAQLQEALEKWKTGYNDVVKIAKDREALRAKASNKAVLAERKLAERERQNLELYVTGREILDRLAGFSLGTALTAREPFVGTTRVKLQNLVQDYADKLQDSKYNPFAEAEAAKQKGPQVTDATAKESGEVQKPKQP